MLTPTTNKILTAATTRVAPLLPSITAAGSILAADAIGCGLIYMIGKNMGGIYARQIDLPCQLSSDNDSSGSSFERFWNDVKVKNLGRCIPGVSSKVSCALVLLLSGRFTGAAIDALPSIQQMLLSACYYGSMGILDEFVDLEGDMKTSTSRKFEKYALAGLVLTIPLLMMMNPPLYVSYGLFGLTTNILSGKIDHKYFEWTAAITFCCAVLVARAVNIDFPFMGMAILALSDAIYEIHDEHPMLIELTRKLPFMNKLWEVLNFQSCLVMLVCFKRLPLSWLSVTGGSYAIAKLGLAKGNLKARASYSCAAADS